MWKRKLIILPNWLLKPLHNMIIIYCKLFNLKNEHEITSPINSDRDIFNLYEKFKPHIEFSIDEENKGKSILTIWTVRKFKVYFISSERFWIFEQIP